MGKLLFGVKSRGTGKHMPGKLLHGAFLSYSIFMGVYVCAMREARPLILLPCITPRPKPFPPHLVDTEKAPRERTEASAGVRSRSLYTRYLTMPTAPSPLTSVSSEQWWTRGAREPVGSGPCFPWHSLPSGAFSRTGPTLGGKGKRHGIPWQGERGIPCPNGRSPTLAPLGPPISGKGQRPV